MLKVALTGNFGSGKTFVLGLFRTKGTQIINSDKIVSSLYKNKKFLALLKKEFATTNKKRIAEIVFSNKRKRKKLESFIHPLVIKEIKFRLKKLKSRNTKLVIVEVPLLFETNLQKLFDFTILVKCSKEKCIKRLKKKGFSRSEVIARLKTQKPQKYKAKRANFIINNNSTKTKTKKQVKKIYYQLVNYCR